MVTKRVFTYRVLLYQALGFLLVTGLVWVDELADLPHNLLGAAARPPNYREGILESCAVFILALGTLLWTRRALMEIRYLEGFLPMCSFCKRIRVEDRWVPIDQYVTDHSAAVVSHGLCPDCLRRNYPAEAARMSP